MLIYFNFLYYLTPLFLSVGFYFHITQDLAYKTYPKVESSKPMNLLIQVSAIMFPLIILAFILSENNQFLSYLSLTFLSVAVAYSRSNFLKLYSNLKDDEICRVENKYRTITYLSLLCLYLIKNSLVISDISLPYFLNTITESLLTFVIIDTILNINKNLHKKFLLKLKKLSKVNLGVPGNRLGMCIILYSTLSLIAQIHLIKNT